MVKALACWAGGQGPLSLFRMNDLLEHKVAGRNHIMKLRELSIPEKCSEKVLTTPSIEKKIVKQDRAVVKN